MNRILALLLLIGFATPVNAASKNSWQMTAASAVHAKRTKSGISISANVLLANACYEAAVQRSPLRILPEQYQVVTRVKPSDVGKVCTMVVVPSVAHGSFIMHAPPDIVTVHATNKTFAVKVENSI
jgi:hypothetical protein